MQHDYFDRSVDTTYDQEQALFAEMKQQDIIRKRKKRRRRILMWVLRRL